MTFSSPHFPPFPNMRMNILHSYLVRLDMGSLFPISSIRKPNKPYMYMVPKACEPEIWTWLEDWASNSYALLVLGLIFPAIRSNNSRCKTQLRMSGRRSKLTFNFHELHPHVSFHTKAVCPPVQSWGILL